MKKVIKPFTIDGEFMDDSVAYLTRVATENFLDKTLRDKGYVRALDIDPSWYTWYDSDTDQWFFSMTIYGIYMGKRKSWEYEGIMQDKLIPRSIRKTT
jgi:hypothetical protein